MPKANSYFAAKIDYSREGGKRERMQAARAARAALKAGGFADAVRQPDKTAAQEYARRAEAATGVRMRVAECAPLFL